MFTGPWRQIVRLAAIPSVVFAAVVFMLGWLPVSPFASMPLVLILMLCLPAMAPFVLLVLELAIMQGTMRSLFGVGRWSSQRLLPPEPFRWRSVLSPLRASLLLALAVVVFISFASSFSDYRGSPEVVDGQLVFTDHGKVIGPATEREADEARTRETRMFTGHLMLFGAIGLLAQVPTVQLAAPCTRPRSGTGRIVRYRPGGPRRPSATPDDTAT